MRTIVSSRQKARGQALAEFALVLPLFVLIVVGVFDFGRAIYDYNALGNAARTATRLAIVDQNVAKIQQTARTQAVNVGVETSDVTVTFSCTDRILLCKAKVAVTHDYVPATPLVEALVGNITLTSEAEMPIERLWVSP
jgi:Flp pilus assembly protein TadG